MIGEKAIKTVVIVALLVGTLIVVLGTILPKFIPGFANREGISMVFRMKNNKILISGGIVLKGSSIKPLSKYRIILAAKIRDVDAPGNPPCQMVNYLERTGKTALYKDGFLYINLCKIVFQDSECPVVEPPNYLEFEVPMEPLKKVFSAVIKAEDETGEIQYYAITPTTVTPLDLASLATGQSYCIKESSESFEVKIEGSETTVHIIAAIKDLDNSGNCPADFSKVTLMDVVGYGLESCGGAFDEWCVVGCTGGENCIFIPSHVYLSVCVARQVSLGIISGEVWTLAKARVINLQDLIRQ